MCENHENRLSPCVLALSFTVGLQASHTVDGSVSFSSGYHSPIAVSSQIVNTPFCNRPAGASLELGATRSSPGSATRTVPPQPSKVRVSRIGRRVDQQNRSNCLRSTLPP